MSGRWLVVLPMLMLALVSAEAAAQLAITIEPSKSEYALSEPVCLRVRYENVGSSPVTVMPARELGSNMTFTFYEVVEPDEVTVRRKHQFAYIEGIVDPGYDGEPLNPSDYIYVIMYPSLSASVGGEKHTRRGFTFDAAGDYRLRLAYSPPAMYPKIWRPADGGPLYSNQIVIRIRPPTEPERRILDAYWSADRGDLAMGDGPAYLKLDENRTRQIIARHAGDPLADFLRLNLACGLMKPGNEVDDEVVALLEELLPKRDFRWEKVHSLLGLVYATRGDTDRALEVLYEGIDGRPELLHNYLYMSAVIRASTGSVQKVIEWEMECAHGERMHFAGVEIPRRLLEGAGE